MSRRRRRRWDDQRVGLSGLFALGVATVLGFLLLTWLSDHPWIFVLIPLAILVLLAWPVIRWWRRQRAVQAYRRMLREADIGVIDRMPGPEFEETLRLLFEALGYRVKLTPAVGDFGADLVLERDGRRTVVQAKRYGHPVGIKAVQEVSAARHHYSAQRALVVTNSSYTAAAARLAQSTGVELWNRQQLASKLAAVRRRAVSGQ